MHMQFYIGSKIMLNQANTKSTGKKAVTILQTISQSNTHPLCTIEQMQCRYLLEFHEPSQNKEDIYL